LSKTETEDEKFLINFCIIISLCFIWFFIFYILDIPDIKDSQGREQTQTLYLLSAVSQSLAAVFALVFTISLVVAQLSSKYSHRILSSLFDKPTLLYISLYVIAILLPFWLIAEFNRFAIKISLSLAATCLVVLIPYFLKFREKLDPEFQINELQKKAVRGLKKNFEKEPEEIATIDNFVMSAFVHKDYDTLGHGVNNIANLLLEVANYEQGASLNPDQLVSGIISKRLRDICITTIEDPRAPWQVIKALSEAAINAVRQQDIVKQKMIHLPSWICAQLEYIGIKTVEKKLDELANFVVDSLFQIGMTGIELRRSGVTDNVAYLLGNVGIEAIEKELKGNTPQSVSIKLRNIGLFAIEKGYYPRAEVVSGILRDICISAIEKNQEKVANSVSSYLTEIGIKAIQQGIKEPQDLTEVIIYPHLSKLISRAYDMDLWETVKALSNDMKLLCITAANYNMWGMVKFISFYLKHQCENTYRKGQTLVTIYLASQVAQIGALATQKGNDETKKIVSKHLRELESKTETNIIDFAFSVLVTSPLTPTSILEFLPIFKLFYKEQMET